MEMQILLLKVALKGKIWIVMQSHLSEVTAEVMAEISDTLQPLHIWLIIGWGYLANILFLLHVVVYIGYEVLIGNL